MSAEPPLDAPTGGLDAGTVSERAAGESFGRYRNLTFLGAGGMANVYRADDPVLGRPVALKLIRGADPGLAERLLSEARAQARIEHENVCRIYDAGQEGDRPYIAMQYVDGSTLQALAGTLGLEQKLRIVRQVAEAVHAAHRVGLIHRDLKPSNVMVERTGDGELIPYVMDFGLAREVAAPGLTMTGMVLGTAWYMSPEQARGDSRTLDRRTDVYALGATLYELVSGRPPYDGQSSLDILMRVLSEDPVPLASRAPTLPADVRTIVMKCLERDLDRRYDSARALADEIGRYLDGEPILARPSGIVRRLAKRARKNRAAVAAGALAVAAVLVSTGLALRARYTARAQAALATEFAQRVQDMEWLMRAAHMAPLHDIRQERALVRERLQALERRMAAAGGVARGPGEYALGRGQILLGDPKGARAHLDRAWAAGFQTPEASYALGQALGELYRRELEVADALSVPSAREARRRQIQSEYRDPAVAHLRRGAASGLAPAEYVEGLLAFYERRDDDALAAARASLARVPWHYEARLLEGEVQALLSREKHERGDASGSRAALEKAEESFRAAADYARSDPAARGGQCQVRLQRMEWAVYQGGDIEALYREARRACEEVLQADPDRSQGHSKLANIHRYYANSLGIHGQDPLPALALAIEAADRAIALDPANRGGHGNRGIAYRLRAASEMGRGLDPAASLDAALDSLRRASELVSDAGAFNDLGNAYTTRAGATAARGGDPRPDLAQAFAQYDRALEQVPDFGYAHANRGLAYTDQARYELEHGHDPAASLAQAVGSHERAVALLPQLEGTHTRLADTLMVAAENALQRGGDAAALLARAGAELESARRVNPRPVPETLAHAGTLALVRARAAIERPSAAAGGVVEADLKTAAASLRAALAADARLLVAQRRLVEVALLRARWLATGGRSPQAALAEAEEAARALVAVRERDPRSWAALAQVHLRRAEWAHRGGGSLASDLEDGLAAAGRALEQDGTLSAALAAREGLLALRGKPPAGPAPPRPK